DTTSRVWDMCLTAGQPVFLGGGAKAFSDGYRNPKPLCLAGSLAGPSCGSSEKLVFETMAPASSSTPPTRTRRPAPTVDHARPLPPPDRTRPRYRALLHCFPRPTPA